VFHWIFSAALTPNGRCRRLDKAIQIRRKNEVSAGGRFTEKF
jgi:hypothetical protein